MRLLGSADAFNDHSAIFAGILNNLAHGHFKALAHDLDADLLIFGVEFEVIEDDHGVEQGHTTTGDDTFFHSGAGGGKCIFHTVFLFLQFGLGGGANTDDGNTTGELGKTFLQFFAVVIAGGLVDLDADLFDAAFDVSMLRLCRR